MAPDAETRMITSMTCAQSRSVTGPGAVGANRRPRGQARCIRSTTWTISAPRRNINATANPKDDSTPGPTSGPSSNEDRARAATAMMARITTAMYRVRTWPRARRNSAHSAISLKQLNPPVQDAADPVDTVEDPGDEEEREGRE